MRNRTIFLAFALFLSLFISCGRGSGDAGSDTSGVEVLSSLSAQLSVNALAEDADGFVWIGTMANGVFRYDGTQYIHFYPDEDGPSLSASRVNHIFIDSRGRVWVSTQKGFDRYDGYLGFEHINCDDSNSYALQVSENHKGEILAMTRRSVLVYNEQTGTFVKKLYHPTLSKGEPVMVIDRNDHLWIGYDSTIICYDTNMAQLASFNFDSDVTFAYDGGSHLFVKDSSTLKFIDTVTMKLADIPVSMTQVAKVPVNALMNISDDIILIRTESGAYCYDCKSSTLHDETTGNNAFRVIMAKAVRKPFIFDENAVLWMPDQDFGVRPYSTDTKSMKSGFALGDFFASHSLASSVNGLNYNWYLASDGVLATYDKAGSRIVRYDYLPSIIGEQILGPLMRYDNFGHIIVSGISRTSTATYLLKVGDGGALSLLAKYKSESGVVATLGLDGTVWAAGSGSSLFSAPMPQKAGSTIALTPVMRPQHDNLSYASDIRTLRNGDLLICFTDNPPVIVHTASGDTQVTSLEAPLNQVYYMCSLEDTEGNLWIGTSDNGLYLRRPGVNTLEQVKAFAKGAITGIEQDAMGFLYVMDNASKLYKASVKDQDFRLVWSDAREISGQNVIIKMPDGSVALDVGEDLLTFNEEENDLQNLDLSIVAASGHHPLDVFTSRDMKKGRYKMKIRSADENFNLRVSPFWHGHRGYSYDYCYSVNRRVGSMVHSLNNPVIPLYNLRYGRNVVRLKVINANTKAESDLTEVVVHVRVPVWFILEIIMLLFMMTAIALLVIARRRNKQEAEDERRERLVQEQINRGNVDFFANISHEFRTPLTLINGAVTMLGKAPRQDSQETERSVSIIRRNTARMLRLVSQMLDFNKLDHDMLRLNVAMEDISAVITRVKESFDTAKDIKNIDFELTGCDTPILGYIDSDKLEKVLSNLLSNAFKYTSPGGRVEISVEAGDELKVAVKDTGIGLQEDKIGHLFERFYRMDSTSKTSGTGIGLCYAKGLVTLHHGTITAANHYQEDASGARTVAGSVFTFTIPVTASSYTEEEMAVSEDTFKAVDDKAYANELAAFADQPQAEEADGKSTMLIIDDDYEMVYYLRSLFSPYYNVKFRFDAMSGYNMIEEVNPDIIICDMMMLDVDGLQLCRMVKENISLCHIPLIMLTAKSSVQDQIDSLNSGADAYVAKPFDPDCLIALAKSMVENRTRLKSLLTTSVATPKETENKLNPIDKEFMDKIYEMMERNLEDGQMDIDSMAESLGVSRSKFYYKIKALTGQTPNDFFTTYKLNRAKELIEDGRYKISAIADMVGFSSGSYFATLFKKRFGVLPSQYRERRDTGATS